MRKTLLQRELNVQKATLGSDRSLEASSAYPYVSLTAPVQ